MILALWATPRSTSTAFEWMMRQRGDVTCFHEPWNEVYYYGEDRRSDREAHVDPVPGRTYAAVWQELAAAAPAFVKDFAYSVEHDLGETELTAITHTFLIRDPERVIQGLARHWPDCRWEEVGFESLHRLFYRVADRDGAVPPVISSTDLLDDPAGTVNAYCRAVGIPFVAEAMAWESGERREVSWYGEGTGPWHDDLRRSTGIQRSTTEYPPLSDDPRLVELHQRAVPLYEDLAAHALPPIAPDEPPGFVSGPLRAGATRRRRPG